MGGRASKSFHLRHSNGRRHDDNDDAKYNNKNRTNHWPQHHEPLLQRILEDRIVIDSCSDSIGSDSCNGEAENDGNTTLQTLFIVKKKRSNRLYDHSREYEIRDQAGNLWFTTQKVDGTWTWFDLMLASSSLTADDTKKNTIGQTTIEETSSDEEDHHHSTDNSNNKQQQEDEEKPLFRLHANGSLGEWSIYTVNHPNFEGQAPNLEASQPSDYYNYHDRDHHHYYQPSSSKEQENDHDDVEDSSNSSRHSDNDQQPTLAPLQYYDIAKVSWGGGRCAADVSVLTCPDQHELALHLDATMTGERKVLYQTFLPSSQVYSVSSLPAVASWSWKNNNHVHIMKMRLAKNADMVLHVMLAILANLVLEGTGGGVASIGAL